MSDNQADNSPSQSEVEDQASSTAKESKDKDKDKDKDLKDKKDKRKKEPEVPISKKKPSKVSDDESDNEGKKKKSTSKKSSKKSSKKKMSSDSDSESDKSDVEKAHSSTRISQMIQWIDSITDEDFLKNVNPNKAIVVSRKKSDSFPIMTYKLATPFIVESRDCSTNFYCKKGYKVVYEGSVHESLLAAIYSIYLYATSGQDKYALSLQKAFETYPLEVFGHVMEIQKVVLHCNVTVRNIPKAGWEKDVDRKNIEFQVATYKDKGIEFVWPWLQGPCMIVFSLDAIKVHNARERVYIDMSLKKVLIQEFKETEELLNGRKICTVPFVPVSMIKKKNKKNKKEVSSESSSSSSESEEETEKSKKDKSKKKK